PACNKADSDGIAAQCRAICHLCKIEKAEIIFSPLSDNGFLRLLFRVGVEAAQLLVELALELLRIGGKPDCALVAIRPEACRRNIADGLANARACFSEHDIRPTRPFARAEGGGCDACEGNLARPRFGI